MQPEFITKPAFTVVGLLLHTTPMTPEIPKLWEKFVPRMDEVSPLSEPNVSYGLMDHFNHQTSEFDYLAGNPVEKVVDLPAGMTSWNVSANTYAVFEATLPTMGQTFDYIYNTWLPASGYKQAAGTYFERYGETFNPEDWNSILEVYIPVEKKA